MRDSIRQRIRSNVKVCEIHGCWIWQGSDSGTGRGGGYARMRLHGYTVAVHRVMFINEYGFVPPKKQIDHVCENRMCVNPDHLEMVSHKENQRRKKDRKI